MQLCLSRHLASPAIEIPSSKGPLDVCEDHFERKENISKEVIGNPLEESSTVEGDQQRHPLDELEGDSSNGSTSLDDEKDGFEEDEEGEENVENEILIRDEELYSLSEEYTSIAAADENPVDIELNRGSFSSIWEFGKHIDLIKSIHSSPAPTSSLASANSSDSTFSQPPGFEDQPKVSDNSFTENRSSSRFLGYFKRGRNSEAKSTPAPSEDLDCQPTTSSSFGSNLATDERVDFSAASSVSHYRGARHPSAVNSRPFRHASTHSHDVGNNCTGYNWRVSQVPQPRRVSSTLAVPVGHQEYGNYVPPPPHNNSSSFYSANYTSAHLQPRSSFFTSNASMMMNSENPYAPPPPTRRPPPNLARNYYYSTANPHGAIQDNYSLQNNNLEDTNDGDFSSNTNSAANNRSDNPPNSSNNSNYGKRYF